MGKYLKMSDYFVTGTFSADYGDIHSVIKYKPSAEWLTCRAAHYAVEHAINSHDELVAEVERLTKSAELAIMTLEEVDRVLTERIKNGAYDLDDISGEVTYALDKISARE